MLTSGVLVRVVAAATEVPEATVALYLRSLREAGLITTGARGVNAARMSHLDAARLLLAIVATDRPARAVEAITDFGALELHFFGRADTAAAEGLTQRIPNGDKLEDIIARVIGNYENGSEEWCYLEVDIGALQAFLTVKEGAYSFSTPEFIALDKAKSLGASPDDRLTLAENAVARSRRYASRVKIQKTIYSDVFAEIGDAFQEGGT